MTYAEFTADIPPERTIEFTSAEEMEEAFQQWGVYQAVHAVSGDRRTPR